jgi:hypothetical protein
MVINYDPAVIIKSGIEKQSGKADVGVDGRDTLLVGKNRKGSRGVCRKPRRKPGREVCSRGLSRVRGQWSAHAWVTSSGWL